VKCSWAKCSGVLQCNDGLSNKVSNIIRRLMDNMKLLFMYFTSTIITFLHIFLGSIFINVYMVLFLFDNLIYVFLLL
jgi:hypothetical protein